MVRHAAGGKVSGTEQVLEAPGVVNLSARSEEGDLSSSVKAVSELVLPSWLKFSFCRVVFSCREAARDGPLYFYLIFVRAVLAWKVEHHLELPGGGRRKARCLAENCSGATGRGLPDFSQ